jgi:hypothetical protein
MTKKATALKWTLIAGALYFFLVSAAHFFEIKWPGVFVYFDVESFQYQNKIISLLAFGWATYFYASTRFIPSGLIQEILFPVIAGALEMASRIPPFVAIKRDPPGEKNYLSFFSEILYDTPSREKTCA